MVPRWTCKDHRKTSFLIPREEVLWIRKQIRLQYIKDSRNKKIQTFTSFFLFSFFFNLVQNWANKKKKLGLNLHPVLVGRGGSIWKPGHCHLFPILMLRNRSQYAFQKWSFYIEITYKFIDIRERENIIPNHNTFAWQIEKSPIICSISHKVSHVINQLATRLHPQHKCIIITTITHP